MIFLCSKKAYIPHNRDTTKYIIEELSESVYGVQIAQTDESSLAIKNYTTTSTTIFHFHASVAAPNTVFASAI